MTQHAKIIYLSPGLKFYGAELSLYELIKNMNRDIFSPILVVPPGCEYANEFNKIGVEIFEMEVSIASKMRNITKIFRANIGLFRFVTKKKASLVHVNICSHLGSLFPFFMLLRFKRIPVVFHNRSYFIYGALERLVMLKGKIVCVSDALRKRFLEKRRSDFLTKPDSGKLCTIYDGRDLERFMAEDFAEDLKNEFNISDKKTVAIIGAIDDVKRQDLYLKIAKEVKKGFSKVKFFIIGDTYANEPKQLEYKKNIIQMCSDMGLEGDVVFTGFRKDIDRLLKMIDVLVLTSKRDSLPGVIVEAMASSKPVVASSVDGVPELVDDGKTGYLINSPDPKDYADRILYLLKNDHERSEMGMAGRVKAVKMFDIKKHVYDMLSVYRNILT